MDGNRIDTALCFVYFWPHILFVNANKGQISWHVTNLTAQKKSLTCDTNTNAQYFRANSKCLKVGFRRSSAPLSSPVIPTLEGSMKNVLHLNVNNYCGDPWWIDVNPLLHLWQNKPDNKFCVMPPPSTPAQSKVLSITILLTCDCAPCSSLLVICKVLLKGTSANFF